MAVTSSGNGDWSSVISGGLSVNDDVIINHDVTLDGNATAVNSLVINSGKTLTGGGNTITIDSRDSATGLSIDINGSTSGELNINITNNLNNDIGIGTDKVHDLTINNDTDARINYFAEDTAITGDLTITRGILNTFNRTLEVDGDCSIAADGKLEANVNGGKDVTLGSLTIASGGIYNATRETTTLTNNTASGTRSVYNNGGTFTHNNGTIKIDTSSGTNYDFDGDDLYNFTVECEDTNGAIQCDGQASTAVTVLNNLDIVMGKLRTNANTFTVHGNVYVRATSKTNKNKFVGQGVTQNVYGLITVEDGAFFDLANEGSGSYGTLNAGGIRIL